MPPLAGTIGTGFVEGGSEFIDLKGHAELLHQNRLEVPTIVSKDRFGYAKNRKIPTAQNLGDGLGIVMPYGIRLPKFCEVVYHS